MHPPILLLLAPLLTLFPLTTAITSIPLSDWDVPSRLDYCASTPYTGDTSAILFNNSAIPCREVQYDARTPNRGAYNIGQQAVVYLNFTTTDTLTGDPYPNTAVFYPTVDDYSELVIPDSWSAIADNTTTVPASSPTVGLTLMHNGGSYVTPSRKWAIKAQSEILYVPSRTAIVTLDNGEITDFNWYQTSCTLTTCTCLDDICTDTCLGKNCTVTVYLGWAGTDATGTDLTSSQRDIWRFQNAI
ncbi:uncharacterized protein EV422DRAFT_296323 [Fimicolochytrium jonesii]|uniref:uncharacterized protein n=1 Tax=Fimicolochytrium jonesii TaxID=1396493 RepID=UPI0022FDF949|nr:uncharacterized protein EV422DRAFT_296323 [Fimicolochytrium jonesii]KAI8816319.1 hypothetical protein EV422DRAFT_296323 [Fimicolochytrium jonesii]